MSDRREALRNLLDAEGAQRLTEEQRLEILSHLEDSVDAKVAAGMTEEEAVTRALEGLGDLGKISRDFPSGNMAVTPEGWWIQSWSLEQGYLLLLFFVGFQGFITVPTIHLCRELHLELPAMARFFLDLGEGLLTEWPLVLPVLVAVGWVVVRLRRTRVRKTFGVMFTAVSLMLFLASLLALAMPIVNLMSGIGRH
jgi:hypothetical protein